MKYSLISEVIITLNTINRAIEDILLSFLSNSKKHLLFKNKEYMENK